MIKVKFALLCDQAYIDQNNKINMIGEFDNLNTTGEKAVLGHGFLVAKMAGVFNKEVPIKVIIKSKSGKEVLNKNVNVRFSAAGTGGLLFEMLNIEFKEFGSHKAQVLEDDQVLAEIDLEVLKIKPQKMATA